jgi:hypothetical protein
MIGIARKVPGIPQTFSPTITARTVISALIRTFDPTMTGNSTLLSTRCIP